jgi:acetoin utilization protein AcuC
MLNMGSTEGEGTQPVVAVYHGDALARYGFGHGHPFGTDRLAAFWDGLQRQGLDTRVVVAEPVQAARDDIETFHTPEYVARVIDQSTTGRGYLDYGDTPAFPGVYEAAACVVGSTLDAVARVVDGRAHRAFVPIAGLHHARRDTAGGFCVFNDCGVAIEVLRKLHGVRRIGYVDIDAHHGDGVLYGFQDDPDLFIADIHEDGRFLYPGTGWRNETGTGAAEGTKLNIPLQPYAGDDVFYKAWREVEDFLEAARPEFLILQCGADGLADDPITHLGFSKAVHAHAARTLRTIADRHCRGRLIALGGGGYSRSNLAAAWCEVVTAFLERPESTA